MTTYLSTHRESQSIHVHPWVGVVSATVIDRAPLDAAGFLLYPLVTMLVCQERTASASAPASVTTYYTKPMHMKIISVPAHYSLDKTHETIHSAVIEYVATQGELPSHDLSSMIMVSGE